MTESPKWLYGSGATPSTGWKAGMKSKGNHTLGHRYWVGRCSDASTQSLSFSNLVHMRKFTTHSSFQTGHSNHSERNKETTGPLLKLDFCMQTPTPSVRSDLVYGMTQAYLSQIIRIPSWQALKLIKLPCHPTSVLWRVRKLRPTTGLIHRPRRNRWRRPLGRNFLFQTTTILPCQPTTPLFLNIAHLLCM